MERRYSTEDVPPSRAVVYEDGHRLFLLLLQFGRGLRCSETSTATTLAPWRANASAVARPMPFAAPVTVEPRQKLIGREYLEFVHELTKRIEASADK